MNDLARRVGYRALGQTAAEEIERIRQKAGAPSAPAFGPAQSAAVLVLIIGSLGFAATVWDKMIKPALRKPEDEQDDWADKTLVDVPRFERA